MHLCERCCAPGDTHPAECELGCAHWPPLCCPGCACGSFEACHPVDQTERSEDRSA